MMWDGFDKRKFPRLSVQCEITVESEQTPEPMLTLTENLGVGGVCVLLDKKLERFSKCRVRIQLESREPLLESGARVVWIVPTGEAQGRRELFDTGLEFVDAPADMQLAIRDFIQDQMETSSS